MQYADGSTETGIVPWPLRYRPSLDPFRLGLVRFRFPGLCRTSYCRSHNDRIRSSPSVTNTAEFPTCPIQHD